jgi:DNA-binding transcriptional MerR regulator
MKMKKKEVKGIKISDLAKITGVPKSTIHYYVKMGLLPSPLKTSQNMAYYDEKCAEQVCLIKELQERKFIPLEHIKHLLWHVINGKVPAKLLVNTHKMIFDFKSPHEKFLTLQQFIKKTGLSEDSVAKAKSLRLLLPAGPVRTPFDSDDVRAGDILKKLIDVGMKLDELAYYPKMINEVVIKDLELHEKVTAALEKEDQVKFFNVTEMMLESAGIAREYFFKRLFQINMVKHIDAEIDEKKIINIANDKEKK